MLGVAEQFGEQRFAQRTVVRNVGLLSAQLLAEVNQIVVQAGLALAEPAAAGPRRARIDSFVVETNVHFPTDASLRWDALRCLLRVLGVVCEQYGVPGWRQAAHWSKRVRRLFQRVRSARQRRGPAPASPAASASSPGPSPAPTTAIPSTPAGSAWPGLSRPTSLPWRRR